MTTNLVQKVRETIKHHNMLRNGDKVLVGVCSGPDSICLLYVLKELQEEYAISLHIAHLHHGFRGSEADEDVQFVKAIGDSLVIPVHIEYMDVPAYIKKRRISKQAGAREVRYKFFCRVATEIGADRIALGHIADDQVETFLMRLLRGSGAHGLSGILPVRDRIIRPLIGLFREEITEYLSERDLRYRIDSSNLSAIYLRNKIRLDLIPYLEKEYNPKIMYTLIRNLSILRDEDIFLDRYTKMIYRDVVINESKECVQFDVVKFISLEKAIKRRLIRCAIKSLTGKGAVDLSFTHVEDSLSILGSDKGGEVHLPDDIITEKDGSTFRVYLKSMVVPTPAYAYTVSIPGKTIIPEAGMTISTTILTPPFNKGQTYFSPLSKRGHEGLTGKKEENYEYKEYFDVKKFSLPLIIRNRKEGDFLCPKGMEGKRKKIKEYFIDLKIPRRDRNKIPILTSPEGILWVIGYRSDDRFSITTDTEQILKITAVKNAA